MKKIVKKAVILLLLLTSIMLVISCKQTVEESIDREIRRLYDYDLEKTIEVLQEALPDARVTKESGVILALHYAGIRGATQARLIDEEVINADGRQLQCKIEIVCEDNRTYELWGARMFDTDRPDRTFYRVDSVKDMQTGKFIYSTFGNSPSTWSEKGRREPVEFDVKATQEVLRSVLVDNRTNEGRDRDGHEREEFWIILDFMRMLGIPGATHAALYVDPEYERGRILEIVSEDGKNYRLDLSRHDSPPGAYYFVGTVIDLDTGEILWHDIDGNLH